MAVPQSTDIISFVVVIGGIVLGIITLLYLYNQHNKEKELENFGAGFLNLEKEKREKLLKEHLKKNGRHIRVAAGVFLNHYDIISEDLREKLLEDVLKKNIRIIENPKKSTGKEHDVELEPLPGNLSLFVIEKHFDIILQHLRNEIITQSLISEGNMGKEMIAEILAKNFEKFANDFRNETLLKFISSPNNNVKFQIAKILDKNFNNIPQEILREALQQLMESENKMNIDSMMAFLFKNFYKIDIFTRDELLTRYVRYKKADKTVLEKFLSVYGKSIINQELKKRMIELVK